ncbi:DUF72 domain-containing protein, partial [Candidatus Parcubacteria bacterium]|nr:DUF72 domain-containing protein [Candidatus Parcubacteria bacterium]
EPIGENITSDFVYMRLHGPKELFASPYSVKELKLWAERIRELRKKYPVHVYFNNDVKGYAIANAKALSKIL